VPIASLTKVMTAFVVLRDHPLSGTDNGPTLTVTAAEAAAYPAEVAKNESLVPVNAGEVLTERQALQALLLPSADNIARILARWDAGDVAAFLARMNTTAASLGMVNTRYTDPSGYDAATRSTAADQVTLGDRAMKIPTLAQIVAMPIATIPVAGTVHNLNTALGQDGIVGVKTGSTRAAGGCLLFAARHTVDGHTVTIIGAVLGQQGASMYGLPQALAASQRLVQATTSAAHVYTAIRAGQTVATVNGIDLVASRTLTVLGWPGLSYPVTIRTKDRPPNGAMAGTLELDSPDGPQTTTLTARR
jgi:D-alanyl-D-alanine carboxypeptidase (penicillin-binding protein 5/6)